MLDIMKNLGIKNACIVEGSDFLLRKMNLFDTNVPLIVYDVKGKESDITHKIQQCFGKVDIVCEDTYFLVKPIPLMEKTSYTFGDLVEIIWRLRDPDGCPWDRAQTIMSIRENAVEEAYELVEAVELNDAEKICEESGDVFLQGLFNAIICEEGGRFSAQDMISVLCKKLLNRHTHIFGENRAKTAEEALYYWEKAKATEKSQKSVADKLNSVAQSFSALMKANKVQKLAAKNGFDFPNIEEAEKKVLEEILEVKNSPNDELEQECGDLLFSVVNVLRLLRVNPELALNSSSNKFVRRFKYVEQKSMELNKTTKECTIEELDFWYNQAKLLEKK